MFDLTKYENCSKPETVSVPEIDIDHQREEYPLESDPELLEFLNLLQAQRGWIILADRGRSLSLRFPGALDADNLPDRTRAADLLYCGRIVPDFVALLQDASYGAERLAVLAGCGTQKGARGR